MKKSVLDWALVSYEALIIILGSLVAALIMVELIGYERDLLPLLHILGLAVLLYGVVDRRPLAFRGAEVSLSFPIVLVAMLFLADRFFAASRIAVLAATAIAVLGSLLSESLRRLSRPRLPPGRSLVRILFYAAHHAVAGCLAAQAYFSTHDLGFGLNLEKPDIEPSLVYTLVYALVYSLVSQVVVWPHDWAIRRLLLPVDERRFPRVDLLTLVVIAPMPLVLFYLFSGEADWAFVVVFLLFLAFLVVTGSYVDIDVSGRRLRAREDLRQKLGTPVNMHELREGVHSILNEEIDYQWAAIYSVELNSKVYRLRGSLKKAKGDKGIVPYDLPFPEEKGRVPAIETLPSDQVVHWPRQVVGGEGHHLGKVARTGEPSPNVKGEGEPPVSESDPYLPSRMVAMYLPVRYARATIGLLALARSAKQFEERDRVWLEGLADAMSGFLEQIRHFEDQLQRLYNDAKDYTTDPDRLQRAMRELSDVRVDVLLIVNLISQSAFRNNLRSVMQSVIGRDEDKAPDERTISLSEDTLREIYREARQKNPDMPPLDDKILENLRIIPSSLEQAFSFRYQWPEISRGPEFTTLYGFFVKTMEARSVSDIVGLRPREPDATIEALENDDRFTHPEIIEHLEGITGIIDCLERDSLIEAMDQTAELHRSVDEHIADPEKFIFRTLLDNWQTAIYTAIAEREGATRAGKAHLKLTLRNKYALPLDPVTVGLQLDNAGPGAAFQVAVEMRHTADYQVISEAQVDLGLLPPLKTCDLEFMIEPGESRELDVQFQITYRDWERRQMRFSDTLRLREALPLFSPISSPYMPGKPLSMNSSVFFDRGDIFRFINQNMVASASQQRVLLLVGERRIGKTSILKQLPTRVKDRQYIHVFVDCQRIGVPPGMTTFFQLLTTCICKALEDEGFSIGRPSDDDLGSDAYLAFEQGFLPQVWKRVGDRRLLIAVDEFEYLDTLVKDGEMGGAVFAAPLRALMQSQDRLAFVFAGTHQLEALFSEYWSVLFNMAQQETIGFLSREDARRLITEPVQPHRLYDDLALDEMLRVTGGHPYFLQLMCDRLMSICNVERRSYVTMQDVRDASENVLTAGRAHLDFMWEDSDQAERDALAGLAKSLAVDARATVDTIAEYLERAGCPRARSDVREALRRLETRRHIVTRQQGPGGIGYYNFTTGLYKLWIQKYHPLD